MFLRRDYAQEFNCCISFQRLAKVLADDSQTLPFSLEFDTIYRSHSIHSSDSRSSRPFGQVLDNSPSQHGTRIHVTSTR